ncbi:uncharacterized protein PRCAT00003397001 [Priceomyces carsonii]|uniref:uncharacterized protein n=1 Tax=Priceomyces carsonii TaxID=28549 RepID=UPI002ED7E30C|nr:unnamed protein product [Priceomyces carsonii]
MSKPKTAIIIYSLYHHIAKLAESVKAGVELAGGSATLYQVPETLPDSLLKKLHAPPRPDIPIATIDTLKEYDSFLFGIPTRFGNFPSQWKAFWDSTGSLWANGSLIGKHAGMFVSTGGAGGGQETTLMSSLPVLVHHGIVFVPLGYSHPGISSLEEVHGGSPWGAGTFAGPDGSRKVSELELEIAKAQGKNFYNTITKYSK